MVDIHNYEFMKAIVQNIRIAAVTSYLPKRKFEMVSLNELYGAKEISNIINTTGIVSVRIADDDQTSSDMCFKAAQYLIQIENIDQQEIGGLVFVSQTPDYILPATSIILQNRLGFSKETVCIDIHYGCSGYIYGLFQAALWISSGACEKVLVLAGDTTSKMINPKDKSLIMVFGDCGTATLVSKGNSHIGFSICSDGSGYDRLIIPAGGFRIPRSDKTKELLIDEDNNGRTLEDLYMDGMSILSFAISNVHKNIDSLIGQMEWNKEDVKLYALHQANNFMVNYIRKKLKVNEEKVPTNIKNYGNTGPASIPLLLSDMFSSGKADLDKVIMSGFGVGLSWGSIACSLNNTNFYEPINK